MEANKKIKNHKVVSAAEWLKARIELLEAEKELTKRSDEVARLRQQLPWVLVDKDYEFDTDEGKVPLTDLFQGRSQLLIYHFMYGPDYKEGCPTCSSIADGFNGFAVHLAHHDVMLWAVSRAPLDALQRYKQRMGWTFPWASSFGSDFNYDFNVSFTEEQQREGKTFHNYHQGNVQSHTHQIKATDAVPEAGAKIAATVGTDWLTYTRELPGMSAFILRDGKVYHTYSAYERGLDGLWGMYQWLDRAPLGRNEEGDTKWFLRHDEYKSGPVATSKSGSCCCS
jgi:predicted dithiol-disulfide oxidoreductase (DUF899 family)